MRQQNITDGDYKEPLRLRPADAVVVAGALGGVSTVVRIQISRK
jgi:hypothetical protein